MPNENEKFYNEQVRVAQEAMHAEVMEHVGKVHTKGVRMMIRDTPRVSGTLASHGTGGGGNIKPTRRKSWTGTKRNPTKVWVRKIKEIGPRVREALEDPANLEIKYVNGAPHARLIRDGFLHKSGKWIPGNDWTRAGRDYITKNLP